MADRGIGLVYGGGGIGMMGAVADAVIEARGEVIGVIPHALASKERARRDVDMRVVNTMHERKAMMAELSDAFIAMPGGFGTLEEMMETITWGQLGIHRKPVGLLNVAGFYDPIVQFLDRAVEEQFIRFEHRATVLVEADPARLLDKLSAVVLPDVPKWIGLAEA